MSIRTKGLAIAVAAALTASGASALTFGVRDAKPACHGGIVCLLKGGTHLGGENGVLRERVRWGGDMARLERLRRVGHDGERGRRLGPKAKLHYLLHGGGKGERPRHGKGHYRKKMKMPHEPSPVPLPAAGWLLAAGLGGLAVARKRKG